MILGLALWTPLALAGAIFYLAHHMIVKANLFLVSGLGRDLTGTMELDRMGGIYHSRPLVAALFFIPAFSLAGFPPLSGFWAKLLVIQASLQIDHYTLAAVAVIVGLLTVYSMVKIWLKAFWKPLPSESRGQRLPLSAWKLAPVCILVIITLAIGIGAEPVFRLATEAAGELMDPRGYVQAVLKGGPP
jgi:multicomponent Na+:H+ antiporter subunit D